MKNPLLVFALRAAGGVLACVPAYAQSTATPSSAQEPNAERVVLNPFQVKSDRDYGYRVTNSVTATGVGTAIGETPVNISVLSQDFVQDIGGRELIDVMRYVPTVVVSSRPEQGYIVRGFTGPVQVDGLNTRQEGLGLYATERIEVMKGPSGVFNGLSAPGGSINIMTIKPLFGRHETSIQGTIGSYEHRQTIFRSRGPLTDSLAYSVIYGNTREESGRYEYIGIDEQYYDAALSWKPIPTVTLTAQYSQLDRPRSMQYPQITLSHPEFHRLDKEGVALYDSRGLARPANYPRIGEQVRAWLNRTPQFGPNEPAEQIDVYDELWGAGKNPHGPEQLATTEYERMYLEGTWQPIKDFALNARAAWDETYRLRRDIQLFRPSGGLTLNQRPADFYVGAKAFTGRLDATYKLQLGPTEHRLLVGYDYRDAKSFSTNPLAAAFIWNPRSDPPIRVYERLQQSLGVNYAPPKVWPAPGKPTRATYAVHQMSAFEGRIRTLIGGRYTQGNAGSEATPQFSLMYTPIRGISLFGNYSESFVPQRGVDWNGVVKEGNRVGKGEEVGLKFDLMGAKLAGTVSVFRVEDSNILQEDVIAQVLQGVRPIRTFSGLQRTEGLEAELIWTPSNRYQVLVGLADFWTYETISDRADPLQVGIKLQQVSDWQVSLWNKYSFIEGALKGAYLAGGVAAVGPFHIHPSWSVTVFSKTYYDATLVAGYSFPLRGTLADVSVRVTNAFDEKYYSGTFNYSEPMRAYLTFKTRF